MDKGPQVLFSKYFHEHSLNLTHPAASSMPQEPRRWELLCGAQHCPGVSWGSSHAEGGKAQGGESGERAFLPDSLATPKEGGSLPQPWSRQWALALVRQLPRSICVLNPTITETVLLALKSCSNREQFHFPPLPRGRGHTGLSIPRPNAMPGRVATISYVHTQLPSVRGLRYENASDLSQSCYFEARGGKREKQT